MRITYGFVYHLIDELDYAKGNVSGFPLQDLETHHLRFLIRTFKRVHVPGLRILIACKQL